MSSLNSGSLQQPYFKKIWFLSLIFISQFIFLVLISYTSENSHFLGKEIYAFSNFLIVDFLGLSIFAVPIFFFFWGYLGLRKKLQFSFFLHQSFFVFLFVFWGQCLLLNTTFINTEWSGLFPRLFHILVIHFISGSSQANFWSVAFEFFLFFISFFLLLKSYNIKIKLCFSKIKNYFKKVKNKVSFPSFSFPKLNFKFFSKIIRPIDANGLNQKWQKEINHNLITRFDDSFETPQMHLSKLGYLENLEEAIAPYPIKEEVIDLSDSSLFLDSKPSLNFPPLESSESSPQEVVKEKGNDFFNKPNSFNLTSQRKESFKEKRIIINQNIHSEIHQYLADQNGLSLNSKKKIDELTKKKEVNENIIKLEKTMREFGINSQVVNVQIGPTITQYEMTLEPGVKISKVVTLTDNLALSLGAKSVRIVAPVPGKTVIGIEIPNLIQETISLKEIVEKEDFVHSNAFLPFALGSSLTGKGVIADLTSTPHLLVAGATGSGKSVCINSIICSFLLKLSPYQVRFLMIDPKMVELTIYNGIPHLLAPVITHYKQAALALKWVIKEMENRYSLLEKHSIRSINSYNQLIKKANQKKDLPLEENTIPYIVIIIDEFADLMMIARKEIEESITRLAAMSRAVGIHLILATQRPSVDVITGIIKANFPSRIAFQVSSKFDSRTILDMMGAEKLLGKGDLLFQSNTSTFAQRIQGTFLGDEEVGKIISKLKRLPMVDEIQDFSLVSEDEKSKFPLEKDEYYSDALAIVQKEGKISTSFLQRKLKIGYNRAARIIETLEQERIISAPVGAKPRELLNKQ